ncbi:hypothetical protein TorRG33x02_160160 [Trema orientale]|uniref:Acyclic terpene utilisation N-terminal domain-containing protein n=1 Tax=Trema orientale TaxID=63057 RepID=A0A2P5ERL0_TREOI|nr:hypothetical protein TorRG33x02_160160 [Trema orientale]
MSFAQLLDLSHHYAEISSDGRICVAKVEGSGRVLNFNTCAQQLLYKIGDPSAYVTPDVIIGLQNVSFSYNLLWSRTAYRILHVLSLLLLRVYGLCKVGSVEIPGLV